MPMYSCVYILNNSVLSLSLSLHKITNAYHFLKCENYHPILYLHTCASLYGSSVVFSLHLNSLNLLQLSHRTSYASVCKIICLVQFNRVQNTFARKVFMLYLVMKPEYVRPSIHCECEKKYLKGSNL